MKTRSHGRRFKAEWLALAAMQLLILALVAWVLWRDHVNLQAQEGERLQTEARVIDENLIRQLEGANKAIAGVRAELKGAVLAEDMPRFAEKLKLLTDAMPGISSMLLLDADGTVAAASRNDLIGKNFRQRDYFDIPRRGGDARTLYVSPPFHSMVGNYVMVVSRVLADDQGRFAGVITATLDPDYFNVVLRSVLYAPDMRTMLFHRDGKKFLDMPPRPAPEDLDVPVIESLLSQHLVSNRLTTLTKGLLRVDGNERIVAMRDIDRADLRIDKPMVVSVSRTVSAILLPWRTRVEELGALSAALVLGSSMALALNQRRRRAARLIEDAGNRERQIASERVELALRGADLGLWDLHVPSGNFVINGREREILGFGPDDPLPLAGAWRRLIHPDDMASVDAAIVPHLRGEAPSYGCEHRMLHRNGHYVWLSNRAMIVERDASGAALRIVGTHLDVSERRRSEERLSIASGMQRLSEERLSLALEGSSLALFDWNVATGMLYHSAQAAAMRGEPAVEVTAPAAELQRFIHSDDMAQVLIRMKEALIGTTEMYHAEFRLRRGADDWLWVRARGRVVERNADGRALRLAGTYADIHDRKIAADRLRHRAEFDSLTGLPNRAAFNDRLRTAMGRATQGKSMALLYLDIDHFKTINDTLGHEAGDQLLIVFASRMQDAVRQSDTVARLAGDEFTIILECLHAAHDAIAVARKLVETLREPIALAGQTLEITTSIGVTLCKPGESDEAALLRRADNALYDAKRRGRNGFSLADSTATNESQFDSAFNEVAAT